jgi:hypothetical protein
MALTQTIRCECGPDVVQLSEGIREAATETCAFITAHQDADDPRCHIHLDVVMGSERVQPPKSPRR